MFKTSIGTAQLMKEITFLSRKESHNIYGTGEEEEHTSTEDDVLRKNYMGVWSQESIHKGDHPQVPTQHNKIKNTKQNKCQQIYTEAYNF